MSGAFPAPVSPPQAAQQSAIGNLLSRVRALEAVVSAAGGEGLQFNIASMYGPDNVGDALMIETSGTIPQDFSLPNGQDPFYDPTGSFGLAINAQWGTLFTSDPINGSLLPVEITCWNSTTADSVRGLSLHVVNDWTGGTSGTAKAIVIEATSQSNDAHGLDMVATSFGGGNSLGIGINANSVTGAAWGLNIDAATGTGGSAVGLRVKARGSSTPANNLAILAIDSSNNPIFEVRNDGSVHIKTGTAVVADL